MAKVTETKLPSVNVLKTVGGYMVSFDDPKKAFGHDAETLKLHLIFSVLETDGIPYSKSDVVSISRNKSKKFEEEVDSYVKANGNWLKNYSSKEEVKEVTVRLVKSDGKNRNIPYEIVECVSKIVGFRFDDGNPKSLSMNMKSFNAFLKNHPVPDDLFAYLKTIPNYGENLNAYASEGYEIDESAERLISIRLIAENVYPFFYDGSTHKSVVNFLAWLKDYFDNYERMSYGMKLGIYFVQKSEKRSIQKSEAGVIFAAYGKSLDQILNYAGNDLNAAKKVIDECVGRYEKNSLSYTLKTIVKDMFSVELEKREALGNGTDSYESEFLEKMSELLVEKTMYPEYYKLYKEKGLSSLN